MSLDLARRNVERRGGRFGWMVVLALVCSASLGLASGQAAPKAAKEKKRRDKAGDTARDSRPGEQTTADIGKQSVGTGKAVDDKSAGDNSGSALTLRDVIAFAKESRTALKDVKDYTAHFSKTERIKGGKPFQQEMEIKFRTTPFSVYLLYQSGEEQGRQAIYIDGRNRNELLVKEAKGLGSYVPGGVSLKLTDPRVQKENRYPVTQIGIANMLETTIKDWEHDVNVPGHEVDVKYFPNAKVKGVPCQVIQVTQLKKLKDLKFHKNRIYFDKETKLPIRGERFGWPAREGDEPPLMEDYHYTNVKTNVKLTDADFSPARYGF